MIVTRRDKTRRDETDTETGMFFRVWRNTLGAAGPSSVPHLFGFLSKSICLHTERYEPEWKVPRYVTDLGVVYLSRSAFKSQRQGKKG